MLKLSKRLSALCDFVTEGNVLADIGTDHGYIPIFLIEEKKIERAIAMDVREGPLLRAKEHIAEYGLGGYIETRISDGLSSLQKGEADTILIAGMGGNLILRILEEGKEIISDAKELILQPQSQVEEVREYLYRKGYGIDRENMVYEDKKYYQIIACDVRRKGLLEKEDVPPDPVYCRFGKLLLLQRHPVLKEYLLFMKEQYETILENLDRQQKKTSIVKRQEEIKLELSYVWQGLLYWR